MLLSPVVFVVAILLLLWVILLLKKKKSGEILYVEYEHFAWPVFFMTAG